ncbi:MAG TPA: DEAD/DEAH box helicase family protein, partial [Agitococcus sp.]|nr:DEAD/DEAH box helicase family protein [Agitococcus sp.]
MKTFNTATDTPKRQFHFEGNLPHQVKAVASIANVFESIDFMPVTGLLKDVANPQYANIPNIGNENSRFYYHALEKTRQSNQIFDDQSLKTDCLVQSLNNTCRVLDIAMETGTGKTYTYTKAMFALNQQKGIFKFIVIVPTLAIKAGTINFLKSTACQEHFALTYGQKRLHCHLVESQKNSKNKKNNTIPQAIVDFVQAQNDDQSIHVLIMNAGMINSPTLKQSFDRGLFDQFTVPFEGIASVAPFIIIDEPHRFPTEKKTWENIQLFKAQFILRFGATFNNQYENLIYRLSSIDAFNQNLVKGVLAYVENFAEGKDISLKLLDTDGTEARFELSHQGHKKHFTLAKNDSLSQIHPEMQHLNLENLNKSIVVLSNGLELKRGDIINPYSYAQSLQLQMVQKAIAKHFELEKEFFTQHSPRIKPLTLFFIDAIESYRGKDGQQGELSIFVEQQITAHAQRLLATETNADYKIYLQKTLDNVSRTHGGYFSKDNSDSDEKVESEINEILHDKESLLDLNNPRRF